MTDVLEAGCGERRERAERRDGWRMGAAGAAGCAAGAVGTGAAGAAGVPAAIGVIGGLGPAASARLYERITDLTDAGCDQEHLQVAVLSCPQVPDRTAYLTGVPGAASFVEPMQRIACTLEALGCDVIAMPCNTSHARLREIGAGLSRARIVSMIRAAVAEAKAAGVHRLLVLATDGTRACKVYDAAAREAGLECAWPDAAGQLAVMRVIYDQVKAGKPADLAALADVCALSRAESGCDGVVLACTELSVIGFGPECCGMPVVDALDALARACIRAAGGNVRAFGS